MKKFVSIVILCGLLTTMFSCSRNTASTVTENKSAEQATEIATEAEVTDDYVYDDLPESNFDGETMNIQTTTWNTASNYIYADNLNGEVINDSLYNSRSVISDRFNVNITLLADKNTTVLAKAVDNMVLADDNSYDLIYNHDLLTVGNALKGDFINIRDIDVIDFNKPWWKGASDNFTVNGKLLFTANHFSLSGIYMSIVLSINKKLAADNSITIPYEKVKAGIWYLDDLIELTKNTIRDLDGDGKMTDKDQYGFLTQNYGDLCIQSDLEGTVISKDSDGYLIYEHNLEKASSILEKVEKLYENGTNKYGNYGADLFMNNQGLFMFSENITLYRMVRTSDVVYGILPFPKFDENQENYRSSGYDIYWGIPITVADRKEMIGTLVEAMSCYNYNNIVPQVWELVLGSKLSDTPDDEEMFKIIRDVQYVDLGYAFSGESTQLKDLIFLINKTKSGNVSSYIEKRSEALVKSLQVINEKFDVIK